MTNNLKEYNSILDSSMDKAVDLASQDANSLVVKSSVKQAEDIRPKQVIQELPMATVIAKSSRVVTKGSEDAPFILTAEDPISENYEVYDGVTDKQIKNLFYANRHTGVILEFDTTDKYFEKQSYSNDTIIYRRPQYNLLVYKDNQTIYFKNKND